MNLKNGLLLSILLNLGFIGLLFYVKSDATAQAKEFVKKSVDRANDQLRQAKEIKQNNNVLWELVMEIQNSSDKSLAAVTRMAKAKRLPDRDNEKAFLSIDATSVEGNKARRIGWEKYSIMVVFGAKDQVSSINIDDLLDKAAPVAQASISEESEESAE